MDFLSYIDNLRSQYPSFKSLKEHVESSLKQREQIKGDYSRLDESSKKAGVLFGLLIPEQIKNNPDNTQTNVIDHIYVILEKRSTDLNNHPGQISLPGGTIEKQDNNLIDTAYREAEEEVGLPRTKPEFIAFMDEFISSTKILVKPVVSWVFLDFDQEQFLNRAKDEFAPLTGETEHTLIIPLIHLMNPENYTSKKYYRNDQPVGWIRYINVDEFLTEDHIWGLTASMIRRFLDIVFPDNPLPREVIE